MVDGRALQALLQLTYFTVTVTCLAISLAMILQWTSTTGDDLNDSERQQLQHIPLPSAIDRVALNRYDHISDAAKDFS